MIGYSGISGGAMGFEMGYSTVQKRGRNEIVWRKGQSLCRRKLLGGKDDPCILIESYFLLMIGAV